MSVKNPVSASPPPVAGNEKPMITLSLESKCDRILLMSCSHDRNSFLYISIGQVRDFSRQPEGPRGTRQHISVWNTDEKSKKHIQTHASTGADIHYIIVMFLLKPCNIYIY